MATREINKIVYGFLGIAGIVLSFIALLLLSEMAKNSENFDQLATTILLINIACLIVLFILLIGNLTELYRDYRANIPGSKLKARMVAMFSGLVIIPLCVVFYFSMQFINRGIDTWFNVEVEEGFDDALALSRTALETQMRDHLVATENVANELRNTDTRQLIFRLGALRQNIGASEITLFGRNSQILATSSNQEVNSLPESPTDEVIMQTRQNLPFVSLDPKGEGRYEIRTAIPLLLYEPNSPDSMGLVRARFFVSERIGRMADSIDSSYSDYKRILFLREPLKRTFSLTLTIVLMISLLASISGAFFLSRRLVSPIQDLVAGTKAVAKGNFDMQITVPSRDEIGFLISSFNDMTKGLSLARKQASLSQAQVEEERTKLEIILASLSTGVISLETDLKLRTANKAAESILSIDLKKQYGKNLSDIAKGHSLLEQLFDIAKKRIDKGDVKWREQIVLRGEIGRRVLLCECTAIKSDKSDEGGFVIVFDDITALQQAQRDAAWGEVARRLAHEIKNPLTPIQLSAERMRRKYLNKMSRKDGAIMDRATHTIVQQVEAMKEMVNAFSDYARAPDMDIHLFGITSLINEIADLYRSKESDIKIIVEAEASLPKIMADSGRVRQMLHNLIRNSTEILEFQDLGIITISAILVNNEGIDFISISVNDNGHGFASESIEKVFDPYVTSKPKGTGLGLAIVKKLVEEHIGRIEAENLAEGGASITILLPLNEVAREAAMALIPTKSENRKTQA